MKNVLLISAISVALLACDKNSVNKQDDPGRIQYMETVALSPIGSLTFKDLNDSRCPENVQCVWAGNVVVDLEITSTKSSNNEVQTVKMCLGECSPIYPKKGFLESDTAFFTYGGINHTLTLTDVSPYPNTTKTVEKKDYSIKLKID